MDNQNTAQRSRAFTVELTITVAGVRKTNTNSKPFVVAKGRGKGGRAITAMTYQPAMMDLLMATPVGSTIRVFGAFEGRIFSPIGLSVPREKAPAAA